MNTAIKHNNFHNRFLHFFPTPKLLTMPSVGIDISDSSIKFLQLTDTKYGKEILRFGELVIPKGIVEGGEIKNAEKLSNILKELQKKHDVKFIRASLPEEKAYLFKTRVSNKANDEQIRNALEFKLEENVPISPREAVFDYDISQTKTDDMRHKEVSVAVYTKETVEKYTKVFRDAGFVPVSFEIEAQAIARAVIQKGDEGTYMIIDFGKMRTGLSIVSNGLLSFTSTLDVVGDTLTIGIAEHFSVSTEEAERIKNESDFIKNKDNSELFATLLETISKIKDEIEKHHRYWNTRTDKYGNPMPRIEEIILCGGSSNVVGLREYLSGSLKLKTERANVWRNAFSFNDVIPELDYSHSLGYATAVGLALRDSI